MNAKGCVKEDGVFKFYEQESSRMGMSAITHDAQPTMHNPWPTMHDPWPTHSCQLVNLES